MDIEHDFEPVYDVIPGKEKVIKDLRAAAKTVAGSAADPISLLLVDDGVDANVVLRQPA